MTDASLWFSRATLRRDVPAAALRALLVPPGESARAGAGHRVVWTLFGDRPDRERDFLWREAEGGVFYFLSRRPPEDRHGLFDLAPPKPFAPSMAVGDRLRFSLRANATVAKKLAGGTARGKPCDVVMDALYRVPKERRGQQRHVEIEAAGMRWLTAQGERHGFALPMPGAHEAEDGDATARPCVRVAGYRTLRIDHGSSPARIGLLDFEGELEVRDPAAFVSALGGGFGRAKAFGCGLMLIRRA